MQALIGVLAVSGMRVGEAIDLDRADFEPATGILLVRNAKFGKSRQLPLHPSSVVALNTYHRRHDDLLSASSSAALFVSTRGTRLRYNDVWRTFSALTGQVGIPARSSSCRPRIHDLRNSFAVGSVLDAYAQNADVQALLPVLSTYLGHADPKHTYWYLSTIPELLALAARRLDTHLGRLS